MTDHDTPDETEPSPEPNGRDGEPVALPRDELLDLLASCELDGVAPDEDLIAARSSVGIGETELLERARAFADVRDRLASSDATDSADPDDELAGRRRERSIAAALAAAERSPMPATALRDPMRSRGARRRVAPVLVAAGVLALGGVGVAVLSGTEPRDDMAATGDAATDSAAAGGAAEGGTHDEDTTSSDALGESEHRFAPGAAPPEPNRAPGPELVDLGAFDTVAEALAAVDAEPFAADLPDLDAALSQTASRFDCVESVEGDAAAVYAATVAGVVHVISLDGDAVWTAWELPGCVAVGTRGP